MIQCPDNKQHHFSDAIKYYKMRFFIVILATILTVILGNAAMLQASVQNWNNEVVVARAETARHIWIATESGIYQVSKKKNKVVKYTTANSILPGDNIIGICVGKYDNVYVATNRGILHYDNFAFLVIKSDNSGLPSDNITAIATDKDDVLWIGTADHGLVKMYNGKCKVYDTSNSSLKTNFIDTIRIGKSGVVLVECRKTEFVLFSSK